MTGRSRRGVKFPHNTKQHSNGLSEGRRASFSDVSEEGSPGKMKASGTLQNIQEVRPVLPCALPPYPGWLVRLSVNLSWRQKSPTPEQQQSDYEKKKANFITRTFWTFVMIGGFFAALFMGHVYILVIITAVQIVSFKEVIAIANVPSRARDLQSTKSLNWYWLATTMYFLYGESIVYYLKHIVLVDKVLLPLATHHRFISFILYVFGAYHACLALFDLVF